MLDRIEFVVLDEADRMLDMGFMPDVEAILRRTPRRRQTALFSATMPDPIVRLAQRYLRDPARVTLSQPRALTVPVIEQFYYQVPRGHKVEALARLLDTKAPTLALVFCATKRMVDELAEELQGRGYQVEALHGDMSQAQRERVVAAAREGRIEALVATDVAARGLDIPEITHVINFDLPQDPEYYVHRIGRTGRYGRTGEALTLVAPWEARELKMIERATGARLQRAELPTVAQVEARERELLAERLETSMGSGAWGPYRELVEELAEQHDPVDLAAAALALVAGPTKARAEIPAPPPLARTNGRQRPPRHKAHAGPLRPERRAPYKQSRGGSRPR
jgi:ATP-dependent RNA helicase DeaD